MIIIKMKLIKEKKGAEKIMSVYWFAILFLVAGAIVYMVSIFYGSPYDVREIEANILINNVADCLSENGKLRYGLNDDLKSNFLELCHLNLNTKDEEIQYSLEIEFRDFKTDEVLDYNIVEGNINLKTTFEATPSSNSIFKSEKSFYVLNNKDEEIIVKIFSIIRKTEKNVG